MQRERKISRRAKVSMYTEQTPAFQSVDALISQFADNPLAFEVTVDKITQKLNRP